MNPVTRRSFLSRLAVGLVALPFLGRLPAFAADAELPLAKENEEPGKALKFCTNADKPNKNCEARKSKDKKTQYCHNCQLFTRLSGEGKAGTGKCMIMPKNKVNAASWCMSWIQNPAIKG